MKPRIISLIVLVGLLTLSSNPAIARKAAPLPKGTLFQPKEKIVIEIGYAKKLDVPKGTDQYPSHCWMASNLEDNDFSWEKPLSVVRSAEIWFSLHHNFIAATGEDQYELDWHAVGDEALIDANAIEIDELGKKYFDIYWVLDLLAIGFGGGSRAHEIAKAVENLRVGIIDLKPQANDNDHPASVLVRMECATNLPDTKAAGRMIRQMRVPELSTLEKVFTVTLPPPKT